MKLSELIAGLLASQEASGLADLGQIFSMTLTLSEDVEVNGVQIVIEPSGERTILLSKGIR